MLDTRLYLLQRISAAIMVPLVLGHIAVMIYAVQDGLSATEILGRTQGSLFWAMFYGLFVLAVSVHAAIGLRVIVAETFGLHGKILTLLTAGISIGLLMIGLRAVWALTIGGSTP